MAKVVVLLRAVNLGPKNKVPMAALRSALEAAEVEDVSTYIASGNVLCTPPGTQAQLKKLVEKTVKDEFGVTTTAMVRTVARLKKARADFPFDVHQTKLCSVSFLDAKPTAAGRKRLAELDFGDDECAVVGDELHLRYAKGVHGSRMTPAKLAKALGVDGTARNLATVDTLIELLSS